MGLTRNAYHVYSGHEVERINVLRVAGPLRVAARALGVGVTQAAAQLTHISGKPACDQMAAVSVVV